MRSSGNSSTAKPNANLRTQFLRIIERAGLQPWPKLFHNLRATRQTELEESFPSHVVCRWLGNSQSIATKHYLQVTDEHFERAMNAPAKVLQNRLQSASETVGNHPQTSGSEDPTDRDSASELPLANYCT